VQAERKAKQLGLDNLELRQADAEDVVFGDETFDSILCSSAMIYLQHIDRALQRFAAWLKPGGSLCFNTPQVFYDVAHSAAYIPQTDPSFLL